MRPSGQPEQSSRPAHDGPRLTTQSDVKRVGKRDVWDLSIPLAQRMWFAADLRSNPCQVNPIRPINSVSEAVVSLSGRSTAELGASPEHIDELNRRSVI